MNMGTKSCWISMAKELMKEDILLTELEKLSAKMELLSLGPMKLTLMEKYLCHFAISKIV